MQNVTFRNSGEKMEGNNQEREIVLAISLIDSKQGDFVCGKCRSMITMDETVCPVCGIENDIQNAIEMESKDVFKAV